MKLSELAKQIIDHIAKNGDVVFKTIDWENGYAHFREPEINITTYGNLQRLNYEKEELPSDT